MKVSRLITAVALAVTFSILLPAQTETLAAGTLKVKAGVIFKNGDVRPVARTTFLVISKRYVDLLVEAATAENVKLAEPFAAYIDSQTNVSVELRNWVKNNKLERLVDGAALVSLDDLFAIPEFHSWLKRPVSSYYGGFISGPPPRYPEATSDKRKQDERMAKYRTELASRIREPHVAGRMEPSYWLSDMLLGVEKSAPNIAYRLEFQRRTSALRLPAERLAMSYVVAQGRTSLSGDLEIVNIPAGQYWLTNLTAIQIGQSSVLWEVPIAITAGKTLDLELSNDNAKSIE